MKEKKKILFYLLILVLLGVFLYCGFQITKYIKEGIDNRKLRDELVDMAVVIDDSGKKEKQEEKPQESEEATEEETIPITVDFAKLKETNDDIVGWLYCEDTVINYPVAQAQDNDYYLYRLLNGEYNRGGTLFMECLNKSDFSDWNTLIYGHNMKNNTMFGTLTDYIDQEYYDEHPVWYLLTPEKNYRIELIAGFVTDVTSEVYSIPRTLEDKEWLLNKVTRKSTFATNAEIGVNDRLITFSTCTYEYNDARYVLIGILKEVE